MEYPSSFRSLARMSSVVLSTRAISGCGPNLAGLFSSPLCHFGASCAWERGIARPQGAPSVGNAHCRVAAITAQNLFQSCPSSTLSTSPTPSAPPPILSPRGACTRSFLILLSCLTVFFTVMFSRSLRNGTCLSLLECQVGGGTSQGTCAAGWVGHCARWSGTLPIKAVASHPHFSFGICCIFDKSSCGDAVDRNCSYVTNPEFPGPYAASDGDTCSFLLRKSSPGE